MHSLQTHDNFIQLSVYDILVVFSLNCPYHLQQKNAPNTIMPPTLLSCYQTLTKLITFPQQTQTAPGISSTQSLYINFAIVGSCTLLKETALSSIFIIRVSFAVYLKLKVLVVVV